MMMTRFSATRRGFHPGPLKRTVLLSSLGFFAIAMPAQSAVVVQYSFEGNLSDTAAGGSVADNLSYNKGVAASATPVYGSGVAGGQAAVFSGNWFQAPDSADADIADNTWAMEAFVKVSAHNGEWERLIVKWGSSNNYHFALQTRDLNFFTGNPVGNVFDRNTAPVTNFTDGAWHHIAFTSSATGSQAWINGTSVFTGAPVTLANGSDPLGIGDFGTGGGSDALRMHGSVDEIRIHDSPIDQAYVNGRMALIRGPVITSFTASPANVPPGGTTTLSWTVQNAATLSLHGGGFTNQDVTGQTGIVTPPLTADATFTLTAASGGTSTNADRLVGVGASVQEPVINEFLAANDSGLQDAAFDGDRPDWIEIYNPNTLYSLALGGYHLTDDPDNLDKWAFPAVSLAPGTYLVVFASEKNRAVAGQKLHTNFKLLENGEYLALVKPDGATIVQQFAPAYPDQSSDISYSSAGYLATPTPGAVNSALAGPAITAVTENPPPPPDADALTVNATLTPQGGETVTAATLLYRVMYSAEVSVPMTAGAAGLYSAVIPAAASTPGQMIRWRITAADSAGRTSKAPLFRVATNSPEYFGTVVPNATVTSQLPIIQRFVQTPGSIDTDAGTRCSLFLRGEFFDNCGIHIRGNTSRSWPKKSHKIEGNSGHRFPYKAGLPRVSEFDLNTTYTDKSYVRAQMVTEMYQATGLASPDIFPVHIRQNNAFYSVAHYVEQPDSDFLNRHGIDTNGSYYKAVGDRGACNFTSAAAFEKKTRLAEGYADLEALVTAIGLTGTALETWLFDNLDVPQIVNFMAGVAITQNIDASDKNFFIHRDTAGSREWMFIPWDLDLTFGPDALNTDTIVYSRNVPSSPACASHPFIGVRPWLLAGGKYDRLQEAVVANPRTRAMLVRRIRAMSDQFLATNWFQNRMDVLKPLLQTDVDADRAKWGASSHFNWSGGGIYTLTAAMNRIKNEYLTPRTGYLMTTHAAPATLNFTTGLGSAGIPSSQPAAPAINFGTFDANPASNNQDQEFVELINPNAFSVDLSGWTLSGGITFTFKGGTVVLPGESIFITPSRSAFRQRTTGPRGAERRLVTGDASGHFSNFGETLTLKNTGGTAIASLTIPPAPSDAQRFLVISEIMYHPEPNGDAEFIELMNISPTMTLNLAGVKFSAGIDFTFPAGSTLAPLARVLLVKNTTAFESVHGTGKPVAGQFASLSSLSNGGDHIKLDDATGSTIRDFTYDDTAPWPTAADGSGSLVLIAPLSNPDHSLAPNWRVSMPATGNPDADDAVHFTGSPDADDNANGWPNLVEYALGPNPAMTHTLTPAGLTFTIPRIPNSDDSEIIGQVSTALTGWIAADLVTATDTSLTFRVPAALAAEKRGFFRAQVRLR